jgi:hypothetical protein
MFSTRPKERDAQLIPRGGTSITNDWDGDGRLGSLPRGPPDLDWFPAFLADAMLTGGQGDDEGAPGEQRGQHGDQGSRKGGIRTCW